VAAAGLMAIRAMLPKLPNQGLLGTGAAQILITWAGLAPGPASRAALDCITLLREAPMFKKELEHLGQAQAGGHGLAERLAAAVADEAAEFLDGRPKPTGTGAWSEARHHAATDVWLPILVDHRSAAG